MSTIYRNYDLKAIKILLKEIGRYRYEIALEQMKIQQPPLGMKGFYLETNMECTFLKYRYPIGVTITIMKVDEFEQIPETGWIRNFSKINYN